MNVDERSEEERILTTVNPKIRFLKEASAHYDQQHFGQI